MFAIEFSLATDKKLALEEGPWHFFQDLMILTETQPMQSVADVEFNEIKLWVKCHNVPLACIDSAILNRIGEKIGEVEEIDMDEGGIWLGKMVRMRVKKRLDAALVQCIPVTMEDSGTQTLVIIKYEKLSYFCYACGRIGHILKDCDGEEYKEPSWQYDQRLRAGQMYQRNWGGGTHYGERSARERMDLLKEDETSSVGREDRSWRSEGDRRKGSEEGVGDDGESGMEKNNEDNDGVLMGVREMETEGTVGKEVGDAREKWGNKGEALGGDGDGHREEGLGGGGV